MFCKPKCNKVLPTVFDDALSYYEVLCKLSKEVEELKEPKYTKLYQHSIKITNNNILIATTNIITTQALEFTYDEFLNYLKNTKGNIGCILCNGDELMGTGGVTIPITVTGLLRANGNRINVLYTGADGTSKGHLFDSAPIFEDNCFEIEVQ